MKTKSAATKTSLKIMLTLSIAFTSIFNSCKKDTLIFVKPKLKESVDDTTKTTTPPTNQMGFTHFIGERFGGGIVYHLWKDSSAAEHGLIVTILDQSNSQFWSNVDLNGIGWAAQYTGDGLSNSNAIISQNGHTNSAAKMCLDLVLEGQSDWYLPSYDEFDLLGQNRLNVNKKLESINGANVLLNETLYWTSTERDYKKAWSYSFGNNFNGDTFKSDYQYVRAIRSF